MKKNSIGAVTGERWDALPRVLTVIVLSIIVVAIGVNTATAIRSEVGVLGALAILASALGVAVSLRYPYLGLALFASAAPIAVAGSLVSTGIWSIACFAGFLLTLRGASVLITGTIIALSNFAAAGWDAGTIDVRVDSTASIAAFAGIAAASIGNSIRGNLRYRREVEQRMREAETTRVTAIERGIAQERLRIARDLHDSVGHQVAVVNMRLGAAEVHLPPGAETAREDLAAARHGVQAVLRETQQILTVLRIEGSEDTSEYAYRSLEELVQSYREAGLQIEDSVDEPPERTSPRARAAIYRIVQEGLTNAQKYGTGTVSVSVTQQDDHAHIQLVNTRSSRLHAHADSGGNGIIGMKERAQSAGGTLQTRAEGRLFWLTATIPTVGAP